MICTLATLAVALVVAVVLHNPKPRPRWDDPRD